MCAWVHVICVCMVALVWIISMHASIDLSWCDNLVNRLARVCYCMIIIIDNFVV